MGEFFSSTLHGMGKVESGVEWKKMGGMVLVGLKKGIKKVLINNEG